MNAEPRFQFSLRTLLILMLCVATALMILVIVPHVVAVPLLFFLSIATPAVLTVELIYGRGWVRAFCIGALFPSGLLLLSAGLMTLFFVDRIYDLTDLAQFESWCDRVGFAFRLLSGTIWLFAIGIGIVCVSVARSINRTRNE